MRIYKSITVSFSLFILLSLFASRVYAGCSSGCGTLENGQEWCWQTCDGGSYPTNDGWTKGSAEGGERNASNNDAGDGGGWVDGSGKGHAGAVGPLGIVDEGTVKGNQQVYVCRTEPCDVDKNINSRTLTDCAFPPACSARQQANMLNAIKNPSNGNIRVVPGSNEMLRLTGGIGSDGSFFGSSLGQNAKDGLQNGSITAIWSPSGGYQMVPTAWLQSPSSPQSVPQIPGGDPNAYPNIPRADCRFCEYGNQKTEQPVSGFCFATEARCADYKLPDSNPIVEYRYPICQIYGVVELNKKNAGQLSTREHPVPRTFKFILTDAEGTKECKTEFVNNIDGDGNPNNDLQVVTCAVKVAPSAPGQTITISSNSVPAEGYGLPIWTERSLTAPANCDITATELSSSYYAFTSDPYRIQVIGLPFTSPWIKVADGTYARSGNGSTPLVNYLPGFVEPFNSSDKDTSSSLPHFLSQGGAGISLGSVHIGSVATISTSNWKVDPYTSTPTNTPSSLFKEIIQKKTYQEYTTSNPAPSALTLSQEITIIDAPTTYTLSSLAFNGGKSSYTLIIKNGSSLGNLTIDTASLNPTGSPALLLIADQITLSNPAATTIGAIVIANTLKTGTGDALHIKGNLSLVNPLIHQRVRADSDDRKPTIFIEFSPDMYLSLLPSLGSTSREWSQIE